MANPAFLEPHSVWPFMPMQPIEFVCLDDVITALCNAVNSRASFRKVFNIAGGKTWRMMSHQYVESIYDLMGVSPEEANYYDVPGSFGWYDTSDSQELLNYQQTTHQDFLFKLDQAIKSMLL